MLSQGIGLNFGLFGLGCSFAVILNAVSYLREEPARRDGDARLVRAHDAGRVPGARF